MECKTANSSRILSYPTDQPGSDNPLLDQSRFSNEVIDQSRSGNPTAVCRTSVIELAQNRPEPGKPTFMNSQKLARITYQPHADYITMTNTVHKLIGSLCWQSLTFCHGQEKSSDDRTTGGTCAYVHTCVRCV